MHANIGNQGAILFIAGILQFSTIITIWVPVTASRLEDTPLSAIGTGPPIRILNYWEVTVTFAIAEGEIHVSSIITQRLSLSAAGHPPMNATSLVT